VSHSLSILSETENSGPASPKTPSPKPHSHRPSATLRILHIINGEHYSGAERVQDLLAQQLPRFGYDVGFACIKPERFPAVRECKAASLLELPMRGKLDFSVARRIARMIEDDGYALVHAHTPRSALVARWAAKRTGVPLVYHVHSPAGRDSNRRFANWMNPWVEWAAVRDADRLIAVSPSLRQYMIDRGFREPAAIHDQPWLPR
jgi:glycosyltransferase involved in cell wall biosynthesis